MGYYSIITNKNTIETDLPIQNLNSTTVTVKSDGNEIGIIPYIRENGQLTIHTFEDLNPSALVTIQVKNSVVGISSDESLISNITLYVQHNIFSQESNSHEYETTPQFKESMTRTVDEQLPYEYAKLGPARHVIRLGGNPVIYNGLERSTDFSVRSYTDILAERDIDPYTGLYDGGHVIGREEGGIHILRYGFDPNSTVPKLIHSMDRPPFRMTINGEIYNMSGRQDYEDGFFIPYTETGLKKISIYDRFNNATIIPIVLNVRRRLF